MHLDAESIERALHGELDAERDAATRAHLSGCPTCAAAVEESRLRERRVFTLFEALDHDPPALDWEAVETPEPRRTSRVLAAAAVAAVLGAGILYALPDFPLRSWIGRQRAEVAAPQAETGAPRSVSGLSIRPTAPLEIVFTGTQESGEVVVEPADVTEVEIRVLGTPVDLESGPDRVTVENRSSRSSYAIRLPLAGPAITIRVGGEAVLVQAGGQIRTAAPRTESGSYRIDLAPAAP
jgi:hypothetical protein